jgi:hypothetical protein
MQVLVAYAVIAAIAFLFHLAWERVHIRLYTNYDAMKGILPVHVLATIGDVAYTLCAVFFVAILKRDVVWFLSPVSTADIFLLAGLGFCLALFVEYKALYFKKWEYLPSMPIIPYLHVGLSPIAQMTVLLPVTVCIAAALS